MAENRSIGHALGDVSSLRRSLESKIESMSEVAKIDQMLSEGTVPKRWTNSLNALSLTSEESTENAFAHLQAARERLVEADAHLAMVASCVALLDSSEREAAQVIELLNSKDNQS